MKNILLLLLATLLLAGCNKEKRQAKKDREAIEAYLSGNNLTAESTESGLHYIIQKPGTGTRPGSTSDVTVAYKGCLLNGSVFDESPSAGITFGLDQVIQGWTEGIPLFKEGGEGVLIIPSALGYGAVARQGIPANSVLIFQVHLIDVP